MSYEQGESKMPIAGQGVYRDKTDYDDMAVEAEGPIRSALTHASEALDKLSSLNRELERRITPVCVSPRETTPGDDKQKLAMDREPSDVLSRVNGLIEQINHCAGQVSDLMMRVDV